MKPHSPFPASASVALGIALGAAALLARPAAAHHSFAMFDFNRTVTITGTVQEFRWTNPHVILLAATTPTADQPSTVWSLELTSPGNLTRLGWNRQAFKAGDRVTIELNPLRDGRHGGALTKGIVLDTGKVYSTDLRDAEKPDLK